MPRLAGRDRSRNWERWKNIQADGICRGTGNENVSREEDVNEQTRTRLHVVGRRSRSPVRSSLTPWYVPRRVGPLRLLLCVQPPAGRHRDGLLHMHRMAVGNTSLALDAAPQILLHSVGYLCCDSHRLGFRLRVPSHPFSPMMTLPAIALSRLPCQPQPLLLSSGSTGRRKVQVPRQRKAVRISRHEGARNE